MAETEFLVLPQPLPDLKIPSSTSTVQVYVIDTTTRVTGPNKKMLEPHFESHARFYGPSFSFLIVNGNRRILFDLGVRSDWQNLPPNIQQRLKNYPFSVDVKKDVSTILDEHAAETGVSSKDIESIVWSHHHWDHTGNVALFPPSVDLLLGPGLKSEYFPGYPTNPNATVSDSDLEGRNVREINFAADGKDLKIGNLNAYDFFGDGSFYLLDTPGHSVGHVCGFARVAHDPPAFIFMGGDACHHVGEMRPSPYLPFPKTIKPSPISKFASSGCPGALFEEIQPNKKANERFYDPTDTFGHDKSLSLQTLRNMDLFDALDSVLIVLAHDETVLDKMDFFPNTINDWRAKDVARKAKWAFLAHLEGELKS